MLKAIYSDLNLFFSDKIFLHLLHTVLISFKVLVKKQKRRDAG